VGWARRAAGFLVTSICPAWPLAGWLAGSLVGLLARWLAGRPSEPASGSLCTSCRGARRPPQLELKLKLEPQTAPASEQSEKPAESSGAQWPNFLRILETAAPAISERQQWPPSLALANNANQ